MAHKLDSLASLGADGHTVESNNNGCIIKMQMNILCNHRYIDGMYAWDFNIGTKEQALASVEKDVSVLDVWHDKHAHADPTAAKWMAYKHAVQDIKMRQGSIFDGWFLRIEVAMSNMPMLYDLRLI